MRPEEFEKDAPGQAVRSTLGHWTFQPDPLPPEFTYDPRVVRDISDAERALGELAGAGRMLPNPHFLIRPFLSREAVLSSRIEGTVTRLDQLLLFEAEPDRFVHPIDAEEVRNYIVAVDHGLAAIQGGSPLSLQLICEVHRLLLQGVRGADHRPGQIRDRAVLIGRSYDFDEARFVPPCHTHLGPLLQDFVLFLREERALPVVVQLALMHYQFETIHPFNDGNGRVGRLLITLMLCERGILPQPLLYLSAYFERNREQYYDHLLEVSRRSAWNEWIGFFARGVTEQARDAANRTRQLLDLWREYRERAAAVARSSKVLALVDLLFVSPFITIKTVSFATEIAFKSAANIVERLERAGMLREITGQQRYRVYCADGILQLLDRPLEAK